MVDYLEPIELDAFFRSLTKERDRLLAQFLYESGCSIAELAELRASAVHAEGQVKFPDRTSTISPELAQAIIAQANGHAFTSRQEESITPKRIQQILKPLLARVHRGKITPHVLRYTHIINAYEQGLSLAAISRQTGLTAIRIAQIVEDVPAPKEYSFRSSASGGNS